MCHCAPVFRIQSTASNTSRVGTGLRPGRCSGMCSSGKCSRIRSHWSSRNRSMRAHYRDFFHRHNYFEIGSSQTARNFSSLKLGGIPMRKRIIAQAQKEPASSDQDWLNVAELAEVEITSEDPAHP